MPICRPRCSARTNNDRSRAVRSGLSAPHAGNVSYADFSEDGSRLVTAAEDGSVVLWDAGTATPIVYRLSRS